MKNLVIVHLESISRQRLAGFASAFPNLRRLLGESLVFDSHFSAATSTLMVVGSLLHGNDFEFDAAVEFEGMRPAGNNRNLFSILRDSGYGTHLLCLDGFWEVNPTGLSAWPDDLPPFWGTNNYPSLFAKFDALTDAGPFAIYWWDQVTHIEHSQALADVSAGLTDQVRRACAAADDALGFMLATLQRKGLLDDTTIVVFGDHGDDLWTHGFKSGMLHATEPYTDVTWTPLAIRDPGLAAGTSTRLAGTIDIAPTCLALLGIDEALAFPASGTSLLASAPAHVHSQNLTANQRVSAAPGIAKAFAVTDDTYTLLANAQGLELYAYRLDPGNHCNLLHFFDLQPDGRLAFRRRADALPHFRAALQDNPGAVDHLQRRFAALRDALGARIGAKRAYVVDRGVEPAHLPDPQWLRTINTQSRAAFFQQAGGAPAARTAMPAFDFSYKLR